MAGPVWLKFFVDTYGWPGGFFRLKKIRNFFSSNLFSMGNAGQSASDCIKIKENERFQPDIF